MLQIYLFISTSWIQSGNMKISVFYIVSKFTITFQNLFIHFLIWSKKHVILSLLSDTLKEVEVVILQSFIFYIFFPCQENMPEKLSKEISFFILYPDINTNVSHKFSSSSQVFSFSCRELATPEDVIGCLLFFDAGT